MPANDYYDSTGAPSTSSTISSSTLRAEFDAIETGFTAVQAALALKASLASPTLVTPNLGTPSAGVATNLTGTAAGLTAGNVTTNANLTGPVTSTGNATAIADSALSIAKTSGLQAALDAKAPIASPTFTGAATASGGVLVTGGTTAQKAIIYDATKGFQIRGGTGSANDLVIDNAAGNSLLANPTGTRHLNAGGSFGRGIPVTKTANFTVGADENWISCVGTGTITVTLPDAAAYQGREIMIKNLAAFTVVSASSNVEPLNSGTPGTAILPATAGKWVTLVSNGTTWVSEQGNT